MLLGDPRQSDQRTQSFHFPTVVHQSLDATLLLNRALNCKRQAPSLYNVMLRSSSARQAQTLGRRAVEVIICMITRDFSVISMTSQASLSLSLSLSLSQKSLTHNIGSASALPIIKNLSERTSGRSFLDQCAPVTKNDESCRSTTKHHDHGRVIRPHPVPRRARNVRCCFPCFLSFLRYFNTNDFAARLQAFKVHSL